MRLAVFLCILMRVDAAYLSILPNPTKRSAITTTARETYRHYRLNAAAPNKDDDEPAQDDDDGLLLDDWLDRPFFDPSHYEDDESSALGKFARLVKDDYNLAETLYAGCFLTFMIIVSQEMLRFQIHGSHYIPFQAGGSSPLWN